MLISRHSGIYLCLFYLLLGSTECWTSIAAPSVSRYFSHRECNNNHPVSSSAVLLFLNSHSSDVEICRSSCHDDHSADASRRLFVGSLGAVLFNPSIASAKSDESKDPLESVKIGVGRWKPLVDLDPPDRRLVEPSYPPTFCTYAARFLIRYDESVRTWWSQLEESVQSLDPLKSQDILDRSFGSFAKSLELAFRGTSSAALYDIFEQTYGHPSDDESRRQIALLFALLPESQQPSSRLESYCNSSAARSRDSYSKRLIDTHPAGDTKQLLPTIYNVKKLQKADGTLFFVVEPSLSMLEVGIGADGDPTGVATMFGQLASNPLSRELPKYSFRTYSLLGLAGAMGCALTHSVVIPLDGMYFSQFVLVKMISLMSTPHLF
jgi:hypothetical protein